MEKNVNKTTKLLYPKDLFAVLCPAGPLKMLINIAEDRQENIPALIYSAGMASFDDDTNVIGGYRTQESNNSRKINWSSWIPFLKRSSGYRTLNGHEKEQDRVLRNGTEDLNLSVSELTDLSNNNSPRPTQRGAVSHHESDDEYEDDDDELNAIKLGLGDFVFYSVLVGKASQTDPVTLCLCTVAILTVSGSLSKSSISLLLIILKLIGIIHHYSHLNIK